MPNRAFGRGGRLPKLINVLSNSCGYVTERINEMHPKTSPETVNYTPEDLRELIKPFARQVLAAIEEREGATSRKRPLELWENEMAQEEERSQKQKKVVDMK